MPVCVGEGRACIHSWTDTCVYSHIRGTCVCVRVKERDSQVTSECGDRLWCSKEKRHYLIKKTQEGDFVLLSFTHPLGVFSFCLPLYYHKALLLNSKFNMAQTPSPSFLFFLYCGKIYHFNHFQVYSLVMLSTFTLLWNRSPDLFQLANTSPWSLPFCSLFLWIWIL